MTKKPLGLARGGPFAQLNGGPGREPRGEIRVIIRVEVVLEMTVLPLTFVEVESVTQRVVLELTGAGVAPVVTSSSSTTSSAGSVEPADERLPFGARHDLGPLPDLLKGRYGPGPPPVVSLADPYPFPDGRPRGRAPVFGPGPGPEAGELEAAAVSLVAVGEEGVRW
ncbi:hypothetical protein vseg_003121 [Gypsophila vaccaria]